MRVVGVLLNKDSLDARAGEVVVEGPLSFFLTLVAGEDRDRLLHVRLGRSAKDLSLIGSRLWERVVGVFQDGGRLDARAGEVVVEGPLSFFLTLVAGEDRDRLLHVRLSRSEQGIALCRGRL